MSEQEMDLNTAIRVFDLVETYDEYKDGLLDVLKKSTKVSNPNEARERVMEIVNAKKADLMKTNPEFKAIMDANIRENKMRADESRALHKAQMAEATADANRIRSEAMMKAESARRDARSSVDDWVAKTRIKVRTPEEAEAALDDKLGCPNPKCDDHGKNRRNIMNDVETCMLCYHRLVPRSEFKDHNRKYWRRFNRKRKKRK